MIESSEDEANDTSSDEDSTLEGTRGRKKKKDSDITSITPSDFEKSKDDDSKQPEERMLFSRDFYYIGNQYTNLKLHRKSS